MFQRSRCRKGNVGGWRGGGVLVCSIWGWKVRFPHHLETRRVGQPYEEGTVGCWTAGGGRGGVRFGTEEATQPGSVPVGLLCSCLRRGRRGRAGCCGPSCTAPAFPSTIYSQVRMLPTSPNPPEQGDTLQVLRKRKQRGELQPHSASRIAAAWSCSLLQREPFAPPHAHFPAVVWGCWEGPPLPSILPVQLGLGANPGWQSSAEGEHTLPSEG